MKLAKNLERLGTEAAFTVLAEAKKLEAKGKPMIYLGLGQPDFKNETGTPYCCVENQGNMKFGCKSLANGCGQGTASQNVCADGSSGNVMCTESEYCCKTTPAQSTVNTTYVCVPNGETFPTSCGGSIACICT